jgi:hypothetical protein
MRAPCAAILAAAIALPAGAGGAEAKGTTVPDQRDSYEVIEEHAFVHEEPDATSPIARRLFRGEVVARVDHVVADDGRVWVEIEMGEGRRGFVLANDLDLAGRFPRGRWRKTVIIRDERPLAISARGMGETHGAALNVRYLPFTRFGMSFGLGPVIDEWAAHGTALTAGFLLFAGTRNLSPYFDIGVTRLSYHETRTKLQITALYVTCGLEWMASFGGFVAAGVTYIRSMDISITVKHDDAASGNYGFGSYGTLGDDIEDGELYQAVQPSFAIGYGF